MAEGPVFFMEKRARAVLFGTAVLLAGMLLWAWMNRPPEAQKVRIASAAIQDIYNGISVTGTVEAEDSTSVSPRKNAVVSAVYAKVGDTVQEGDVVCTLADAPAGTDEAAMLQSVWNAISGFTPDMETAAQSNVIYAPQNGVVVEAPKAGEAVWAGMPCVCVADLTHLRIRAQTPELYAGTIERGQKVNITTAADDSQIYAGKVESVSPVAVRAVSLTGSSASASVETLIALKGDTEGLRPGGTVTAKIFNDLRRDAVVVPFEAVCQRGEQEYVFILQSGCAVQRAVTTGYLLERLTEVRKGLTGQEQVILEPSDALRNGDVVEVCA